MSSSAVNDPKYTNPFACGAASNFVCGGTDMVVPTATGLICGMPNTYVVETEDMFLPTVPTLWLLRRAGTAARFLLGVLVVALLAVGMSSAQKAPDANCTF